MPQPLDTKTLFTLLPSYLSIFLDSKITIRVRQTINNQVLEKTRLHRLEYLNNMSSSYDSFFDWNLRTTSVRHTEPSQKKTSEHEGQEKNKLDFKKWRKVCDLITTSYTETYPKL